MTRGDNKSWAPRLAQEARLRQLDERLARSVGEEDAVAIEVERAALLGALDRRSEAQSRTQLRGGYRPRMSHPSGNKSEKRVILGSRSFNIGEWRMVSSTAGMASSGRSLSNCHWSGCSQSTWIAAAT